jgi:hypothetical protein
LAENVWWWLADFGACRAPPVQQVWRTDDDDPPHGKHFRWLRHESRAGYFGMSPRGNTQDRISTSPPPVGIVGMTQDGYPGGGFAVYPRRGIRSNGTAKLLPRRMARRWRRLSVRVIAATFVSPNIHAKPWKTKPPVKYEPPPGAYCSSLLESVVVLAA